MRYAEVHKSANAGVPTVTASDQQPQQVARLAAAGTGWI